MGYISVPNRRFVSADQAITSGGLLSLPHGLGAVPYGVLCELICQVGEIGYSAGDVLVVGASTVIQDGGSGANGGVAVWHDITNVNVRFGSAASVFAIQNKGTGAGGVNITNANWKFRVKAWL